jgi:hypothetical protein
MKCPLNSLVVVRNWLIILLSKIWLVLVCHSCCKILVIPNLHLFLSLASMVAELLATSLFFTKLKLQNIAWTCAATSRQKIAAD